MTNDLPRPSTSGRLLAGLAIAALTVLSPGAGAVAAQGQEPGEPSGLQAAIDSLGSLDYAVRTEASKAVRRAQPAEVIPLLREAAAAHSDGYVRFRALVLLTGLNDSRTGELMREMARDPNDRLREVAYHYFEANPDPSLAPLLLRGLETETSEFVRPALVRALAALGSDAAVREKLSTEAYRGEDFFRSGVIAALGRHEAAYALAPLLEIAGQDGPLQDDAVLALGWIGDASAVERLAGLQRTGPRQLQPIVAAALCLIGRNCESHTRFLVETMQFTGDEIGFQELLRSAATGLGALAESGRADAFHALIAAGKGSQDPVRAPIALAIGTVALRQPDLLLTELPRSTDPEEAVRLLQEAFDMLAEDYAEEQFYAFVRRSFWASPEDSPVRGVVERLITVLDF